LQTPIPGKIFSKPREKKTSQAQCEPSGFLGNGPESEPECYQGVSKFGMFFRYALLRSQGRSLMKKNDPEGFTGSIKRHFSGILATKQPLGRESLPVLAGN
jgi:hypothetical protein